MNGSIARIQNYSNKTVFALDNIFLKPFQMFFLHLTLSMLNFVSPSLDRASYGGSIGWFGLVMAGLTAAAFLACSESPTGGTTTIDNNKRSSSSAPRNPEPLPVSSSSAWNPNPPPVSSSSNNNPSGMLFAIDIREYDAADCKPALLNGTQGVCGSICTGQPRTAQLFTPDGNLPSVGNNFSVKSNDDQIFNGKRLEIVSLEDYACWGMGFLDDMSKHFSFGECPSIKSGECAVR
jgi:hypothetical protein